MSTHCPGGTCWALTRIDFGHWNNVKNTSLHLILRDCGIVMTWMQSRVGWLVGNFIWQHVLFHSSFYDIQRWFGLPGGIKTFPHVLTATSQWYMQRWCLGSVWIGPQWWHIAVLTSLWIHLTFPWMLVGTRAYATCHNKQATQAGMSCSSRNPMKSSSAYG